MRRRVWCLAWSPTVSSPLQWGTQRQPFSKLHGVCVRGILQRPPPQDARGSCSLPAVPAASLLRQPNPPQTLAAWLKGAGSGGWCNSPAQAPWRASWGAACPPPLQAKLSVLIIGRPAFPGPSPLCQGSQGTCPHPCTQKRFLSPQSHTATSSSSPKSGHLHSASRFLLSWPTSLAWPTPDPPRGPGGSGERNSPIWQSEVNSLALPPGGTPCPGRGQEGQFGHRTSERAAAKVRQGGMAQNCPEGLPNGREQALTGGAGSNPAWKSWGALPMPCSAGWATRLPRFPCSGVHLQGWRMTPDHLPLCASHPTAGGRCNWLATASQSPRAQQPVPAGTDGKRRQPEPFGSLQPPLPQQQQ